MYKWLRNTHLISGLTLVLFVIEYGLSSVQMTYRWFSTPLTTTDAQVAVPLEVANSPRALARELMDNHRVRGEMGSVQDTADGYKLEISRPGTEYRVEYSRATGQAKIRTASASNFVQVFVGLHHVSGFWRGYFLTRVWGVFVALVSIGLILMGLTGIYLWFKIPGERIVGSILLALSLGYSLTVMILIRAG